MGIGASHSGSVCLLKNGKIFCAIQEERLSRVKRDRIQLAVPSLAFEYCLQAAKIKSSDLSLIVASVQGPMVAANENPAQNLQLARAFSEGRLLRITHHYAHAVSAYCTSGFRDSLIAVVDGMGSPMGDLSASERACIIGKAQGGEIVSAYLGSALSVKPIRKWMTAEDFLMPPARGTSMCRFRSWGGVFESVSQQIFDDRDAAGKVMGLAAFGQVKFTAEQFYDFSRGALSFRDEVPGQFHLSTPWPGHQKLYSDLAASAQNALESGIIEILKYLKKYTRSDNLAYAGGVALNTCVNQKIAESGLFKKIHVIPAAEDSGVSLGAAFHGYRELKGKFPSYALVSDQLGRAYSASETRLTIQRYRGWVSCTRSTPIRVAHLLASGKTVGWFSGRSELGPRALGGRSILADPRNPRTKAKLNLLVKNREAFRPFAPVLMAGTELDWFEKKPNFNLSRFMLGVEKFKPQVQSKVPAVVHHDGTGRLQSLSAQACPDLHKVLKSFARLTGIPILVNTSLNVAGEPLVETPEDALRTFLLSELDSCVLNGFLVRKKISRAEISKKSITIDAKLVASSLQTTWQVHTPWGKSVGIVAPHLEKILLLIETRNKMRPRAQAVNAATLILKLKRDPRVTWFELIELWNRRLIRFD